MLLCLQGRFVGTRAWLVGVVIALAACESSNGPQPQVVARLDVVAGNGQEGRVGTELADALVVRVLDERGKPVEGQIVNFRVISGGGSVFAGTGQTNAQGEARERWVLGTSTAPADSQRVEARAVDAATGAPLVFATFRATATPDVPASVAPVGSATRAGAAGEAVGDSLVVRVADRHGNPVPGVAVTWAAGAGGSFSPATSATRADGTARAQWTLGGGAGPQGATAAVAGLSAAGFTATAGAAGVARIEASPESIRFNAIGRTQALTVAAFDRFGNPVQGAAQLVSLNAAVVALDGATARAAGNGTARIVATVPGSPGADTITVVVQQVAATVTIPAGPATLVEGETVRLTAAAADSNGVAIRSADVRWNSSAPGAATVDGEGLVTAVGGGEATISATVDGAAGSRSIIAVGAFRAASIEVGGLESCALDASGAAYCWGYLAETGRSGALEPARTGTGFTFARFTAGGAHRCGVTPGGAAYCWGINVQGQIGTRSRDENCRISISVNDLCARTPAQVEGGITWKVLSAGDDHTCGVATSGAAYCWGLNEHGQLGTLVADTTCGIGSTDPRPCAPTPRPVSGGYAFQMVSAGRSHSCGLATNGAAFCWGANDSGQLGDGSTTASRGPVRAAEGVTFTSIDAGQHHTCGVTAAGDVYCWGANGSGQLGDGGVAARPLPVRVGSAGAWRAVTAGRLHSCGIALSGEALCWGTNAEGQIGEGSTGGQRTTPTPVAGGLRFTAISAAGGAGASAADRGGIRQQGHTCGIAAGGVVHCWGGNEYGQVGDGSTNIRPAPVRLLLRP